ncbi:MAG: D-hexose-6-phosphate mutarotase [bacterium]
MIHTLQQRLAGIKHVRIEPDSAGRPLVVIDHPVASATVSLYGGHLLSYCRAGERERLFLSETAVYEDGKAIRGGVPVCWPWFGPDPEDRGRPAHGFARTALWSLLSVSSDEESVSITLELETPAAASPAYDKALWSHEASLQLRLTVGTSLLLSLVTRNTGATAFALTQALHTYFAVDDIDAVSVTGLDDLSYLDKANGGEHLQQGDVRFTGEVDRIYLKPPAVQRIKHTGQGDLSIESSGNASLVVWNPWVEKAAAFADMPDEAYRRFVCVETTNAAPDVVTLEPGKEHCLQVAYRFEAGNIR